MRGAGAVADLILDGLVKFGHGTTVFRHVEERVVAKAAGSGRGEGDLPFADSFHNLRFARWVSQGNRATKAGGAPGLRRFPKFSQQFGPTVGVSGVWPGVAGGVQAGAKVAEMFGGLTQQLPDSFSPAAAHLNARGDRRVLRKLLVDGTRFSVMLATPLYIICVAYMERLLRLLTGEAVIVPE